MPQTALSLEETQIQEKTSRWFSFLRDQICEAFEKIENDYDGHLKERPAGGFERKSWHRPTEDGTDGGGGTMSLMRGRVFEKVGVNVSTVHGRFEEAFIDNIPGAGESDGRFWASGISVVAHMQSPLVPAVHFNTRHIMTSQQWFGGGADLTPIFPDDSDTKEFHDAFRHACDTYDDTYYPKFKKWCDDYFYLPHRKEARGVGGIFFDNLNSGNWDNDFNFIKDIGQSFCDVFPKIVYKHMNKSWTGQQREHQLVKRGRYVEFNLLYDRGTKFGLETAGNTDAILMSMPPSVKWP